LRVILGPEDERAPSTASDFSVAWQCLSKRTIGFSLRIKLHADAIKPTFSLEVGRA
jgi:hypothetical protein